MSRYQDAGVDVNAGYELVHRIKDAVKSTDRPGVIGGIGSFGGMFDLEKLQVRHPILVSGTDGVGTNTVKAMQSYYGTYVDGYLDNPSPAIKAFQRALNNNVV